MAERTSYHPSDEQLTLLADNMPGASDADRAHVRSCERCRERASELLRLHVLLRGSATRDRFPRRDLVPSALKRLRMRRTAISNANEFFGLLSSIVRGFTALFALEETSARDETANGKHTDAGL